MKISVFGLGYVGTVTAACLARERHRVVGVDLNDVKVDLINGGRSPVIEKDIPLILEQALERRLLSATVDGRNAVLNSELSFVCVGTPSQPNGSLDLKAMERVISEIGSYLTAKKAYHLVVVRSTMLPGTTEDLIIPTLERKSGKRSGVDFGVVVNPEFMREGSAVYDYDHPPKIVIGAADDSDAGIVARLYEDIDAPLIRTRYKPAEAVKYVDNAFHALKIVFSNEIGNICKAMGVDAHDVMDIFCQDTKLNLSCAYLKPGFAFGGSCLPKDVRALTYQARSLDRTTPVLNAILPSNEMQIKSGIQRVLEMGVKRVGVLGFAFKAGTDDLRESPMVELIETLLGKGFSIKIYDREVSLAKLIGANREYIEKKIPHIQKLMVDDIHVILEDAELIIIGNRSQEFLDAFPLLRPEQTVLDLVRIARHVETRARYEGLSW